MHVAFASKEGKLIDDHFGWAKQFYLYAVDANSASLVEVVDSSNAPEAEAEKLAYKIACLKNADIVYTTQIGPTASKMVQAGGIHPVRVAENEPIETAIAQLQGMLSDNPPLWLLRIAHKSQARSQ
ncbi:MAG: hypothetical protein KU37_06740 [Sulfuricurvum sp. PC08-66]|nr:MAG: hypothetical protein KU37_06740 [Sulfuricurvum sp. PC08-66]